MDEHEAAVCFHVIEYMNVPIGYALFNYGIESIEAFSMISMIVTALNNGLGGFLNIQKQSTSRRG